MFVNFEETIHCLFIDDITLFIALNLNDMNKNSQQYVNVIHLEAHERKRSAEDYFQRTLMAIFLLRCLQDGRTFFPDLNVSEGEFMWGNISFIFLQSVLII